MSIDADDAGEMIVGALMLMLPIAGAMAWGWAGLFYGICALCLLRIFASMGAL